MVSPKSYVWAVCLVGIFGTLGVHHFYLGRWVHGMFDLGLVIIAGPQTFGPSSSSPVYEWLGSTIGYTTIELNW